MKPRILICGLMTLVGCLLPSVSGAQFTADCAACIRIASCDDKRQSCVAECRAPYFMIDPKRETCFSACSAGAIACIRQAETMCRTRGLCQ